MIPTRKNFIDGFALAVPKGMSGRELERVLKDQELEVHPPKQQRMPDCFWVQLASSLDDLIHNSPLLEKAAELLAQKRIKDYKDHARPSLKKLDMTRDLLYSFFAPGNWREKYNELQSQLNDVFDTCFIDNGNSFDTCFQFVDLNKSGPLHMRIKIYNKFLALFQSDGVMKSLGMNTKGIYYPSINMNKALVQSKDVGLTRIEISYTVLQPEGEKDLFSTFFWQTAHEHLDSVMIALR